MNESSAGQPDVVNTLTAGLLQGHVIESGTALPGVMPIHGVAGLGTFRHHEAIALIGCEVDVAKLFHTVEVRSCSCQYDLGDAKRWAYCPLCGVKIAKKTARLPIPAFQCGDRQRMLLDNLDVIATPAPDPRILTPYLSRTQESFAEQRLIAGLYLARTSYTDFASFTLLTPAGLSCVQAVVETTLSRYGLWDAIGFGVWAVQTWS